MGDEEFDLSDSEDEALHAPTTSGSAEDTDEVFTALSKPKDSGSELESEHSDWFKVEPNLGIPRKANDSETEEDNDSDNYDLNESDTAEDDDDEWLSISKEVQVKSNANVESCIKMRTQSSNNSDFIEAPQIQDVTVSF